MNGNHAFKKVIGAGWFDAPYIRALLDTESSERTKDIEGPASDALLDYAGWSFIEEPLHIALLDEESKTLAIVWIAATTRGLNLTYIVSGSAEGKGLASLVVAKGILAYSEYRPEQLLKPGLSIHAQYEQTNQASASVARRLGLVPVDELAFDVVENGLTRYFNGSEAAWDKALRQAQSILLSSL